MEFCKNPYQAAIDQPIILPSPSETVWKKFEYFDRMADDYPEHEKYDELRWKLLDLWFEQFQKEYEKQAPIFKNGGKK